MFKDRLRIEIILWLAFLMVVAYVDRVNFSMAAPIVMKELGWTAGELGMVFSAFTLGYAVLNFPGGFIVERFGARATLTCIVLFWSLMTGLTPIAWSFASMLVIRIIFGMFEGPMIPATTKCVSRWVTPKERGLASGMWMGALPVGVVIGNPLSALIIAQWGWHSVFYIYASFGLLVSYVTWKIIRNRPEDHPKISKGEIETIKASIEKHEGSERLKAPGSTVSKLLCNPWVWVISLLYVSTASLFWVNLSWLPTYFMKARGSSLLRSGFISALPWLAGAFGSPIYGWLSDRFGSVRGLWLAIAYFIIAPFVAYACITPSLNVCLLCFMVGVFLNMGCLGLLYAIPMEIFPPADVAKASGIMLGWGSLSGVASPTIVGFIVQYTDSFNAAYYVFVGVSLCAGLLAFALIAKERATHRQKEITLSAQQTMA